jgi:hypothetical protein
LEAFEQVAATHPTPLIEHHRADLPLVLPTGEADALPLLPGEIIAGISGNGCWMVLWAIERGGAYRSLIDEWIAPVRALVPASEGRLRPNDGVALIASPGAIVPAHVDNNHNVLFQIEGTKQVCVGEFVDERDQHRQVERRYGPEALNLERLPENVTSYDLGPGDALYVPPYTCHWVVGGPEPSVAVSCSFTTDATRRAQDVHACNARLRKLGLEPSAPGRPLRDLAKVTALRAWLSARKLTARLDRGPERAVTAPGAAPS